MGIEKKVLSIRLDQDLIDTLKMLANDDNRPLSNLIETVLKQYVKAQSQGEQSGGEGK